MNLFRACSGLLLLLAAPAAMGVEASWEHQLARRFSPRWAAIGKEAGEIREELPRLPAVPVADQGGTGGFASLHPAAEPAAAGGFSLVLDFPEAKPVDLVALVPARRYGVEGLESQFGLPDGFSVELLDASGAVIRSVVREDGLWANPVRAGQPFVYPVDPPVEAAGVRISASRLRLDPDVSDSYVHAWAEIFAFSGQQNVAYQSTVTAAGGSAPAAPWQWANAFVVDGLTPLGLPEAPGEPHMNVGWMSEGKPKASDAVWVELDLGEERDFDAIRLFPAKRPTSDLPSGFGFPRKFTVSIPQPGGSPVKKEVEMTNPGHNPVFVPLERTRGRSVKIEATELWKAYENFPAFVALSEVEVLDGEKNVALGAAVRSSGGMGAVVGSGVQYWIASSLSDGYGPDGKLVSQREWLLALDKRLGLEMRLYQLQRESEMIVAKWRRAGLAGVSLLGLAGAFVLVYLPIRYRMREKRELSRVRERIAGDLHDEVGSNLGSIQMLADLAEGHAGATGPTRELKRIQRIAAETVSAVRDIVWLLRPQGDHRIGTVEHLRETSSIMLEPLEWEFTANEAAWQCEMTDEANRHLFLFFREALHNLLRHSGAKRATIRVECDDARFHLTVADDGSGIPPEKLARPSTLRALRQRVEALGAEFKVESQPGEGTRLELGIPLHAKRKKKQPAGGKPGIASA
ncbi:histidine kinase [Luteolibacter flavescens]|uniref:Histidine kinase n=1 Tax=Luteolibacter flavescens TaxID=1859460 RepID=A0ABT3FJW4_9BACT|nr:histidine kinase [Luteolibacter flavescens]MCW1883858.1 histidine kinase [Luteolibacter flavescens]